jgi:hypothetical protein
VTKTSMDANASAPLLTKTSTDMLKLAARARPGTQRAQCQQGFSFGRVRFPGRLPCAALDRSQRKFLGAYCALLLGLPSESVEFESCGEGGTEW